MADPLIVHWPAGIGTDGATRHQYVHAIDVMPTLLELIGIEPPDVIAGVEQSPIEGVSFAPSLTSPDAPDAHITQYYEMLGSRALYHDGWKAVVFHTSLGINYDGSDVTIPFDDDVWELYHVAVDFAEVHDLAAERPDKLEEMKQLWWEEAAKYKVLPLNNQPGRFGDRRYRRQRHEFYSGIGPLPEAIAPTLKNRSFVIAAEVSIPAEGATDGVIVAHGGHAGGYVLYLLGRRLHYVYNFLGSEISTISADTRVADRPTGGPDDVHPHRRRRRRCRASTTTFRSARAPCRIRPC